MKKYLFFASLLICYTFLFGIYIYSQNIDKYQTESNNVVEAVSPNFPVSAAILNLSSKISVEVNVNSEGKVNAVKIISGHPLFRWEVEKVSNLWLFESSTKEIRHFTLFFDFVFMKYDGKEEKQMISFKPPFEIKIIQMIPLKEDNRIPHPPAIINRKKEVSKRKAIRIRLRRPVISATICQMRKGN